MQSSQDNSSYNQHQFSQAQQETNNKKQLRNISLSLAANPTVWAYLEDVASRVMSVKLVNEDDNFKSAMDIGKMKGVDRFLEIIKKDRQEIIEQAKNQQ